MSELWSSLCDAAHKPSVDSLGLNPSWIEGFRLDGSVDVDANTLAEIFSPLLGPLPSDRPLVIGHLAQSLDGCIARANGESHWISGEADLDHTHRLRAFWDAVLVGAETVSRDDCQLTVRRVDGPHPVRLVLDPRGRLTQDRKVFQADGGKTLWVLGEHCAQPDRVSPHVEVIRIVCEDGQFALPDLMTLLHERGVRRLFVEGGGVTISHFLQGGLLDRLHIAMAPVLIGGGRPTIGRALGTCLADSPRPVVRVHSMGADWLFDCDFRSIAHAS